MSEDRSTLTQGTIAGVVAATVIVIFFLVLDAIQGQILRTPEFLAGVLLGDEVAMGTGAIALYTILHYSIFAGVGAATAWVLDSWKAPASIFSGAVLGFLLFDVVFYLGVLLRGVDVVTQLGWPAFLAGNLLGGISLMLYLAWTGTIPTRRWSETLAGHRTLREGLTAGLLGAGAVAVWFFVVDLATGRLFYTPGALGSALFLGADSPATVQVTAATVLGYTGVHLAGFLTMGLVFAGLVIRAERHPPLLTGLVLLFVAFETLLVGLVVILASWLLNVLPWWGVALSNLVAASTIAVYLWRAHPDLAERVTSSGEGPA